MGVTSGDTVAVMSVTESELEHVVRPTLPWRTDNDHFTLCGENVVEVGRVLSLADLDA